MFAVKFPETVTSGSFGPSPSKSLEVKVIVVAPFVKVVVTVVITSSSFTGSSSLLHDVIDTAAIARKKIFVLFKLFNVFMFLIINF